MEVRFRSSTNVLLLETRPLLVIMSVVAGAFRWIADQSPPSAIQALPTISPTGLLARVMAVLLKLVKVLILVQSPIAHLSKILLPIVRVAQLIWNRQLP